MTWIVAKELAVEGEAGAPLEQEEVNFLAKEWKQIEPYLPEAGRKAIMEQGTHILGLDGDFETPLVNGKECYTLFTEKDSAMWN